MTGISPVRQLESFVKSTHLPLNNISVPREFFKELFSNLDIQFLLNCSLVSKMWNELVNNSAIWEIKAQQRGFLVGIQSMNWKIVLISREIFSLKNICIKKVLHVKGQFGLKGYFQPHFFYSLQDSTKISVVNLSDKKKFRTLKILRKIDQCENYKNSLIVRVGSRDLYTFKIDSPATPPTLSNFDIIQNFRVDGHRLTLVYKSGIYFKNLETNEESTLRTESAIHSKINKKMIFLITQEEFQFVLQTTKKIIHQKKSSLLMKGYERYQVFINGNYFFINFFSSQQNLLKIFEISEEGLSEKGSLFLASSINLITSCHDKYFNISGKSVFISSKIGTIFLLHIPTMKKIYEVDTETYLPIRNLVFKNYYLFVSFTESNIAPPFKLKNSIQVIDMVSRTKINSSIFDQIGDVVDFKFYHATLLGMLYDKKKNQSTVFVCKFRREEKQAQPLSCSIL